MSVPSKTWSITAAAAIFVTAWFLWPWLSVIVLTALMAYLFHPLFVRLRRKKGRIAAASTLIISFLVVIIPILIIVLATVGELARFADTVGSAGHWQHMPEYLKGLVHTVNGLIEPITGQRPSISEQGIIEYLRTTLPEIARGFASALLGILASLPRLGIAILIYVFLFIELLLHGPKLIDVLKKASPFSQKVTDKYFTHTGLMANAMVKGQLAISFIISLCSAALLIPLGYGHLFFIFLILFTVLNFIPLGCGIIVIPLAVYSMLTGQFWMGLMVIIGYYAVGYLDPILRPRFIPKTISLSNTWTIIGTFCGIAYFGILGVVYGPILMILIINTWKFYIESKSKPVTAT